MIKFTILGKPIALKRHRPSARGGYYDPSSKDKRNIMLQIAKFKPKQPFAGNIQIQMLFVMPHPKSHYRSGKFKHLLKNEYEGVVYHSFRPDLDNLVKMICDVIQGKDRIIIEDSQICRLQAEKIYGKKGRTEIIIEEIP
tara:strand:+ start:53 stop:472 length:420 start_codon:yes stop_codon:yes gene_type:complete